MKIFKRIIICIIIIVTIVGIGGLGTYVYLKNSDYDIIFPLEDVACDGAEYVMVRYGPDAIYVINDTEALAAHKHDVVALYPKWLENSTGDGFYIVYKDGECIFSCDIIESGYFDFFLTCGYETYTVDEYNSLIDDIVS